MARKRRLFGRDAIEDWRAKLTLHRNFIENTKENLEDRLISSNTKNIKLSPELTEFAIQKNERFESTKRSAKAGHAKAANSCSPTTLSPRNVNYFAETFKLFL